jgi:hypothetical protein
MRFVAQKRLPFAPLAKAVGDVYIFADRRFNKSRLRNLDSDEARRAQVTVLAEIASVSRRTIHRWMKAGVPDKWADEIACALGMHPLEIWPEWAEGDDDDL